jgi:hypothetical protein
MKTKTPTLAILMIALLFSACERTTVQPGRMIISTDTPSPTNQPSQTLLPATPTWTLFPTWTLNQTQSFDLTSQADYPEFNQECGNFEIAQHLSPDGNWTFCDRTESIEVLSKTGTIWTLSYRDYFGSEFYGYTRLVAWTPDSRYLYFAPMATIDGIYPVPYNGIALIRMDVDTGKVQSILPGRLDQDEFYVLSVSPNGRWLAFVPYGTPDIANIVDLEKGGQRTVAPGADYHNIGWFKWSDDGTELSFSVLGRGNFYHLTYALHDLKLVSSEIYVPDWWEEIPQVPDALTETPTP